MKSLFLCYIHLVSYFPFYTLWLSWNLLYDLLYLNSIVTYFSLTIFFIIQSRIYLLSQLHSSKLVNEKTLENRELRTSNRVIISLILTQFQENHVPKTAILTDKFSISKKKEKWNYKNPMIVYYTLCTFNSSTLVMFDNQE